MKHKVVIAITGASGAIYAKVLLDQLLVLKDQIEAVGIVMSDNAKTIWQTELDSSPFDTYFEAFAELPFTLYEKKDFNAPFASGSAKYTSMLVVPCSMGMLARIATGISDTLVTRSADVMLKERRKLILLVRENPYGFIHLKNMLTLTQAGGIVCPANPSFYSQPKNIEQLAKTVTSRVLDLAGFKLDGFRWGEEQGKSC